MSYNHNKFYAEIYGLGINGGSGLVEEITNIDTWQPLTDHNFFPTEGVWGGGLDGMAPVDVVGDPGYITIPWPGTYQFSYSFSFSLSGGQHEINFVVGTTSPEDSTITQVGRYVYVGTDHHSIYSSSILFISQRCQANINVKLDAIHNVTIFNSNFNIVQVDNAYSYI